MDVGSLIWCADDEIARLKGAQDLRPASRQADRTYTRRMYVRTLDQLSSAVVLARSGQFPPLATKSTALLTLNLTLPALLISKISVAINTENVNSIGPIFLIACIYMVAGAAFGLIIRRLLKVPYNFRHGIVFSLIWTNTGDLPNAVLTTICLSPPFSGQADSDLAVAYISIFMVLWYITLFPLQGHQLVKADYQDTRRGVNPMALTQRLRSVGSSQILRRRPFKPRKASIEQPDTPMHLLKSGAATPDLTLPKLAHHASSPVSPVTPDLPYTPDSIAPAGETELTIAELPNAERPNRRQQIGKLLKEFFSPCVIAVIIGLIIALVRPVHALFIETPGAGIPNAPPPLAILMETATFLGNANVPLGLIILGSSMARMQIPRPISRLPLASIGAVAIGKLIIMPVLGVALVQGLTARGVIDQNAKVLRFCLCFFSAVPSATFQVALSQVYAPNENDSNASILCAYLLMQYCLLPLTLTIATAVSLSLTF